MPIYKIRVHYTSYEDMEIEAKDEDSARDIALNTSGYNEKEIQLNRECGDFDVELKEVQNANL